MIDKMIFFGIALLLGLLLLDDVANVNAAYSTIQDEGINLTQQQILNFLGTAVTCINDSRGVTNCSIITGAGPQGNGGNNGTNGLNGSQGNGGLNGTNGLNGTQGLQGNGGLNGTSIPQLNYTHISLHAGRVAVTNLGTAVLNWSSAVFDFSEQKIPQGTQIRIGCSASVIAAQTGDLIFKVMVGSTFLTNTCTIISNVVAMNTAVTNYEAIPASSGNTTIVLSVNDSAATDDPIIYSAWVEMRKP